MLNFLTSLPWLWIGVFAFVVILAYLVLSFLFGRRGNLPREEVRVPARDSFYATKSDASDPRLHMLESRVSTLERQMRRLGEHLEAEARKTRSQEPVGQVVAAPSTDAPNQVVPDMEHPSYEAYRRFVDRPEISDEAAVAALGEDANTRSLIDTFNRMAERDDRGGLQAFAQQHGVFHLSQLGTGQDADVAEEGSFWAVEVDSETHLAIIPSAAVVQGWQKFYRDLSGLKARNELGPAFDVREGPALRVIAPAWARRTGERTFRLVARGVIEGI